MGSKVGTALGIVGGLAAIAATAGAAAPAVAAGGAAAGGAGAGAAAAGTAATTAASTIGTAGIAPILAGGGYSLTPALAPLSLTGGTGLGTGIGAGASTALGLGTSGTATGLGGLTLSGGKGLAGMMGEGGSSLLSSILSGGPMDAANIGDTLGKAEKAGGFFKSKLGKFLAENKGAFGIGSQASSMLSEAFPPEQMGAPTSPPLESQMNEMMGMNQSQRPQVDYDPRYTMNPMDYFMQGRSV